jgi:hypothetical protein
VIEFIGDNEDEDGEILLEIELVLQHFKTITWVLLVEEEVI